MLCFLKLVFISFFLIINFSKIALAQSIPDMSNLDYETKSSIEIACVYAKTKGPAKYANCIRDQLRSIGINPR